MRAFEDGRVRGLPAPLQPHRGPSEVTAWAAFAAQGQWARSARRRGDDVITNPGGDRRSVERIRLPVERGFLVTEVTMTDSPRQTARLLLMPQSDTEAILLRALNHAGQTIRMPRVDREERLIVSGCQARRICAR